MTINKLIEDLRWYAFYCDRTNNGCMARQLLREAAEMLERYKAKLELEALLEICPLCGVEECIGKDNCPSIAEYVRRVTEKASAEKSRNKNP